MYGRALQRAFAERAMVSLLNHQALTDFKAETPRLVSSRHRENHLPSPAFSLSAKEVALVKIPTQFEALFFLCTTPCMLHGTRHDAAASQTGKHTTITRCFANPCSGAPASLASRWSIG